LEEDEVDAARDLIEQICGSMESVDSEWSKLQLSTIPSKMAKSLDYLCRRVEKSNGKVEISTMDERMNFWQRFGKCEIPALSVAAVRLLSCHTTTCATERNWSVWGSLYKKSRSRLAVERAAKLIYISANLTEHKSKSEEEIMLAVLEDGRSNEDKESEDVEVLTLSHDHMSTCIMLHAYVIPCVRLFLQTGQVFLSIGPTDALIVAIAPIYELPARQRRR
jgi:hypothetical protein